jgi:hypothetical protein
VVGGVVSEPAVYQFGDVPREADQQGTAPLETVMDVLKAETVETAKAAAETLGVPVRAAGGVAMRYCSYLDKDDWNVLQAQHGGDEEGLAYGVLVHQARGLSIDGRPASGEDGQPLTYRHRKLQELLGAEDAFDAVKKLYIKDGHIVVAYQKVMQMTGWAAEQPDPTQR